MKNRRTSLRLSASKKTILKLTAKRLSEAEMGRFNIYVRKKLYEDFQEACEREGYAASAVLEDLMTSFLER